VLYNVLVGTGRFSIPVCKTEITKDVVVQQRKMTSGLNGLAMMTSKH